MGHATNIASAPEKHSRISLTSNLSEDHSVSLSFSSEKTVRLTRNASVVAANPLLRIASIVILAVTISSGPATACGFDLIKPERSAIDWIVEADELVIARPRADNEFAYGVSEFLVGSKTDIELPGLVSSTIRRQLALNKKDGVLFARVSQSEDGIAGSGWRMVAKVDETFRPILDAALANRIEWRDGYDQSRQDFVDGLQGNSDPIIRALVISEFDKMPYERLRTVDIRIPPQELLSELWTKQGYPYQAILVLLLGLSGDDAARAEVHAFIDRVEDWDWANDLGAFSAALVELDGAEGVEKLADRFLLDPEQPLEKLEEVVMALAAINRLAEPEVQTAIGLAISDFIATGPDRAEIVARQFAAVSDWSQAATLQPLVRQRSISGLTGLLTVSVYLARAREANVSAVVGLQSDG
jgi:hypothetical protein